jgi:CheY-like chemotaxis protein
VNTRSSNGWQNQHQAQRTARGTGTATKLYGAVAKHSWMESKCTHSRRSQTGRLLCGDAWGTLPKVGEKVIHVDATVLIIDDAKDVREALAKVLRNLGYETLLAAEGIEAFEIYKKRQPDLVLLDLNMPRRNGRAIFQKITTVNPLAPIVILTARPDQFESVTATHVEALLEKPFDVPLLIQTVQQLIEEPIAKRLRRLVYGNPRRIYVKSGDIKRTDKAGAPPNAP